MKLNVTEQHSMANNITFVPFTVITLSLFMTGIGTGVSAKAAGDNADPDKKGGKVVEIIRAGSQPSRRGPEEWFTGTVRIDPLFDASEPARTGGALVTFEPGARTAWHTHPLGQTLIVTSGLGRVQREGGPIEEIRPGDVVRIPPGERHWHGASLVTAMSHIAVQEALNGSPVTWLEHVTNEQYETKPSAE